MTITTPHKDNRLQTHAIAALLVVQLVFGALPIASKFVLEFAHPFFVVVLRSLFATVFFFILHRFFLYRSNRLPRPFSERVLEDSRTDCSSSDERTEISFAGLTARTHCRLAMLAFFGITFNQMALFVALPHTSAAVTSIISPSIALFTLLFSVLLGREKFQFQSLLAIALGACGVVFVLNPFAAVVHGSLWADSLNVLSAASYAFYLALVGQLPSRVGGLRYSTWLFVYGLLMNLVVLFACSQLMRWGLIPTVETLFLRSPVTDLPIRFWVGLSFLLFGATALTYFLNMWALQRVKPSLVGGFVCLQTLVGLSLSKLILHEKITHAMFLGSALILSGVLLLALQHVRAARAAALSHSVADV